MSGSQGLQKARKANPLPKERGGILGLRYLKSTSETVLDEDKADSQEIKYDPQTDAVGVQGPRRR